ncbi:glycosyltransferase family 4 protein [Mucilaginibacter sp. SP1R1]|uniref:glycosyltransferase family 4 protein n=1 Tax=Mucilaginibacter sp. SP1R1 TaxID=2723091 RepID=UPI0016119AC6|nr:glycosyltransferase family 4 protein [Mucilaginibacter sp. SP1R1]MBB6150991.1 glycosyltransferase involved in cell wall biosynthesis [Mucilaginibacter sp. SP1R1]
MKKKCVLVSCGTKFHSDYVSEQLNKHNLLEKTITAHPANRYLNRIILPRKFITCLPPIFVIPYLLKKIPLIGSYISKFIEYRLPAIYDFCVSNLIGKSNVSITWSWASLYTINEIQKRKGVAIVEESGSCNLYQNQLLTDEYKRLGLHFSTPTPTFIIEREFKEVKAANYILCPSKYVADSFIMMGGLPHEKFIVIPYGVNLSLFKSLNKVKNTFKIIFVGTIGVRKGLIYLFESLKELRKKINIECILIGNIEKEFEPIFKKHLYLFTYLGRAKQTDLLNFYNDASVFVLPTLDEGMALVQLEAMACGLPVICTTNSGADTIIEDGIDGFIVPIRDANAITEKITFLYHNKDKREEMSINAEKKAKKFSWDAYGEKLQLFINSL